MKLSVETKVAAAVAAGFAALTVGAIAQSGAGNENGTPQGYGRTNGAGATTQITEQGYNSSLSRHMIAKENSHRD